jgi:DNA-binding MarR family transcriptional regulator
MRSQGDSSLLIESDPETDHLYGNEPVFPSNSIQTRKLERFIPRMPQSLADTGLSNSTIEQLILKLLYFKGDVMGSDLCRAMGLTFSSIDDMIDGFKLQQLIQVKSSLGFGPISEVLSLTERGRRVARDYLDNNQYVGPAPVPLGQYCAAVEAQRMPANWLTLERLTKAYSHLVISDAVFDQIGPAITSGKSFLIYGQPGNGKTQIAEALAKIQSSDIYLPYALEAQGNIIQLYDPIYHELAAQREEGSDSDAQCDGRWALCRRPFIATGGELSLSMLDLSYNAISKIYDAPFQLKANNGIYLVDDFGRQKATSAEILNRWIVPMERRIDYLSFSNGGKMTIPFETFLIFSTNLTPEKLGDEAFLRRIQYKMLLRSPGEDEFRTIFCNYCESRGLGAPVRLVDAFISKHYLNTGKQFRRCHPRDVISQAIDYIQFKRLPYELTEDLLDQAFASCFLSTAELSET